MGFLHAYETRSGLSVYTVCSRESFELVKRYGADYVFYHVSFDTNSLHTFGDHYLPVSS